MSASAPLGLAPPAVPAELLSACRELAARYPGIYSPETVVRAVYESYQLMIATGGRRVDTAEHAVQFAADWLAEAARGPVGARVVAPDAGPPRVLFVCVHGSGRAQMAESLLRRRAGGRLVVQCSGAVAGHGIRPAVVAAMAELGLSVPLEQTQVLLDDLVCAADVIVTMGCGDICPVYVGKRYRDWLLPEPVGEGVAAIRPLRDGIGERVEMLFDELMAGAGGETAVLPGSGHGGSSRDEAIRLAASSRPCSN